MSGFDIASTQNSRSFLESLKRRKAFGLTDSDDEDEILLKKFPKTKPKTSKKKSSKSKSKPQQENTEKTTTSSPPSRNSSKSPSPPTASTSNENPYLASAIELDTTPFIPPTFNPASKKSKRSTFNSASTENIINVSDEDDDDLLPDISIKDLDPDLAALTQSIHGSPAQPEKIVVKLQYTHNFNFENLSDSAKRSIQFLEKPIKFKVMDNTEFRIILTNFCTNKKYLKLQDVYLTYNGDIVFLSGTPASVGMRSIGTHKMEVYPKKCYDNMLAEKEEQKQKERMRHLNATENEDALFDDDAILNAADSSSSGAAADAVPEEERVRLNLRTSDSKVVSFRVKHTTTLRELVGAFKQRSEVSGEVKLSFEGETLDLDQSIEDTDLEDQDIVEVITK